MFKTLVKKAEQLYQQFDLMTLLQNFVDKLLKYHSGPNILLLFVGLISVTIAVILIGIERFYWYLYLWWPSMVTGNPLLGFKVVVLFLLTVALYFIRRKGR